MIRHSIHHTKHPQRDVAAETNLKIVGSNMAVWQVINLGDSIGLISGAKVQKLSLKRKENTEKLSLERIEWGRVSSLQVPTWIANENGTLWGIL